MLIAQPSARYCGKKNRKKLSQGAYSLVSDVAFTGETVDKEKGNFC